MKVWLASYAAKDDWLQLIEDKGYDTMYDQASAYLSTISVSLRLSDEWVKKVQTECEEEVILDREELPRENFHWRHTDNTTYELYDTTDPEEDTLAVLLINETEADE